jgi:hypothetical protein
MAVVQNNSIALVAKVQQKDATRLWIDGRREFFRWRRRLSKREREPVVQLPCVGPIRMHVYDSQLDIRRREEKDEGKC